MVKITTIGIDPAKTTLNVHGVDDDGKVVVRKAMSRAAGRVWGADAQGPPRDARAHPDPPQLARDVLGELNARISALADKILHQERRIEAHALDNWLAERIMAICGISPIVRCGLAVNVPLMISRRDVLVHWRRRVGRISPPWQRRPRPRSSTPAGLGR